MSEELIESKTKAQWEKEKQDWLTWFHDTYFNPKKGYVAPTSQDRIDAEVAAIKFGWKKV